MIAFFVILALLMVLVVAAGMWSSGAWGGPRTGRRVIYDRGPATARRARPELDEEVVEEEWSGADGRPGRRVVRRRRY